jgi:hypothetical protein
VISDDVRIASHERLLDRDQVAYDWQHYIPLLERKPGALRNGEPFADMPAPLRQLKHDLMRRTGVALSAACFKRLMIIFRFARVQLLNLKNKYQRKFAQTVAAPCVVNNNKNAR